MKFERVTGHDQAKKILENCIKNNKVSHAYIFEGASGIGKLTLAKAFAEALVGGSADSHPDIVVVTNERYGSAAKNSPKKRDNILIDTVRAVKADVYIRPYSAKRKVYIIPNADLMQEASQNSLLKVFEEPPEYCTIILTAADSNALLQTIRSRAQLIHLRPLGTETVAAYLKENHSADSKTAAALAAMSGGSIGKALRLLDDSDAVALRSEVIGHLIKLSSSGAKPLYDFIRFLKRSQASIQIILDIMADWSADVFHIKIGGNILNIDHAAELKAFASCITREATLRFNYIVTKYRRVLNKNANYPIAVHCMATEYWEEIHGRNYRSAL